LSDLRFGQRIFVEPFDRMIVNVNKTGSEDEPVRIDDAFAGSGNQFTESSDAMVTDAESASDERSAGAVGKLRVDDEGGGVGGRMRVEDEGHRDCEQEREGN